MSAGRSGAIGPAREVAWTIWEAGRDEARGDWRAAAARYEAALEMQLELARQQSTRMLIERALGPSHDLSSRLAYAWARAGHPWRAVAALETGRARLLSEKLTVYESAHSDLTQQYVEALRALERLRDSGRVGGSMGELARLRSLRATVDALGARLRDEHRLPSVALPVSSEIVPALLKRLDVLYLFHGELGGHAVLHRADDPGELRSVELPRASLAALASRVAQFSRACSELRSTFATAVQSIDEVSRWLGEAALAPLVPQLRTGRPAQLAVVACGAFSLLPVLSAWLPADDDVRRYPLIDAGSSYIPNAQVLRALAAVTARELSDDVLVVGLGSPEAHGLPQSAFEARDVAEQWSSSRFAWRRDDVLAALPTCTLAHFCTHGVSRPDRPLRSGILLGDGSWLEMRDLVPVALDGAPLCVLSACDTAGVGHTLPDEGTGLVAGLLSAGARGVIASMWPVDDTATRLLMRLLHEQLAASGNAPAALQSAQRSLRRLTVTELRELDAPLAASEFAGEAPHSRPFAHPFHWAGFAYTGRIEAGGWAPASAELSR
jgi:hypothetical protein